MSLTTFGFLFATRDNFKTRVWFTCMGLEVLTKARIAVVGDL